VRLISMRHLNGPNIFISRPAAVARLELDELTGQETSEAFAQRLLGLLPGLAGHHCAAGAAGGFLHAMARGTYFGHVVEHTALELSALAGRDVHFGRTMWAGAAGRYDVVTECPRDEPLDSPVPRELLGLAMFCVSEIIAERAPPIDAALARLSHSVEESWLGVSTAALATAARRRGIPVRRVGSLNLLRLGHGCRRRLVWAALTEQTSAVGVDISCDKVLAKQLLDAAGVPVPEGTTANSAAEAAEAFAMLDPPVVVKPRYGNHGGGITIGVTSAAEAARAYHRAAKPGLPETTPEPPEITLAAAETQPGAAETQPGAAETTRAAPETGPGPRGTTPAPQEVSSGPQVIVEKYVPGTDYRVLVVDGRVVAASQVRPAAVTGDGAHDIQSLVEIANADPNRGDGHSRPLSRILLDAAALAHLAAQNLRPHSVPGPGTVITLRRNANLSTGGTSTDVTDLVHPEVAAMSCRAAATTGMDVCGIDLRLADISAPWTPAAGAVIELNASPGLRMHLAPSAGRARDVAGPIIDRLYPPGVPARIPVISVTGTNGKTTTVRMIGHILAQAGVRVGMATTDGVHSAGRLIRRADDAGPRSAEMILDDPAVEAAVLETARGGIVRRGLGYDQADVAVVTNITADHLGMDGIDDLDDLTHVKALVAEQIQAGGTLVLNADDPRSAALAHRPAVRKRNPVIRYFSLDGESPLILAHRMSGGIACELREGRLVETRGGHEAVLLTVDELPGSFSGSASHVIANALAACAACRALGVSVKDIRRALASFTPAEANPGRGNVYRVAGRHVVVDYGHNPAALDTMGRLLHDVWGGDPVAAVTLPGDRRDDLVAETAAAIAKHFGKVVVYEDNDLRGRRPGEMTELITATLAARRPNVMTEPASGPGNALRSALAMAGPSDPVLLLYEELPPVREILTTLRAEPCTAADPGGEAAAER
jgi:cyanophycin synthetase